MKRVLIIGGNGAGKTTFSYKLCTQTGFPLIHIDKVYWRDHWEVTPREEFRFTNYRQVRKYLRIKGE